MYLNEIWYKFNSKIENIKEIQTTKKNAISTTFPMLTSLQHYDLTGRALKGDAVNINVTTSSI